MKLFKLNLKIDYGDSIINSMTSSEQSNIYSRKVITEINRNYNTLWKENDYGGLKIFVNYIFMCNYIIDNQFYHPGLLFDDNYVGQLSGKPLHLLSDLKDNEYFIGTSEKDYRIYLRNKKLKNIKEKI